MARHCDMGACPEKATRVGTYEHETKEKKTVAACGLVHEMALTKEMNTRRYKVEWRILPGSVAPEVTP